MKITRESISALTIDDSVKSELLGLFDSIGAKEKEMADMRAKVPSDSQQIVEKTDIAKFTAAQNELAQLKQKLAEKLSTPPAGEDDFGLSPFTKLFEFGK